MANSTAQETDFFVAGGTLRYDAPSYVQRPADTKLFEQALSGQFCYVLTARQMGKSSLMVRTARRLQDRGVHTAIIDLTQIGTDVQAEQWYLGLLRRLRSELHLNIDIKSWWSSDPSLSHIERFTNFLHDIILAQIEGPVTIFVDEIDSTLSLDFSDDFFAAIRAVYNARANDSIYERLTFILLGVATPGGLIKDRQRTPFNIGQRIDLREFSRADASILQTGLETIFVGKSEHIFDRIFSWTSGHPYLTQKLCATIATASDQAWFDEQIDDLVNSLFLAEEARGETNLHFVRDSITNTPQRRQLLKIYRQVYRGKSVADDERSLIQNQLKLIGLVQTTKGHLQVRNEIYRQAFNQEWIEANAPRNWVGWLLVTAVVVILILLGVIYWQQQQAIRAEAQVYLDNFRRENATAEERISSLVGLLALRGFEEQAFQLFFEQLDRSAQLALFNSDIPQTISPEFIALVARLYKRVEIYWDLKAYNQEETLLFAMIRPLRAIDDPLANSLATEIEQWLAGRDYHDQRMDELALAAYNLAVDLHDQHPGTHLDRGIAHAAQGQINEALTDLQTVIHLDETWIELVQAVMNQNARLRTTLFQNSDEFEWLATIVPTPTITPTPTSTPGIPFIAVATECLTGERVQLVLSGANWPSNQNGSLAWSWTNRLPITVASGESGFIIQQTLNLTDTLAGQYSVLAAIGNQHASTTFEVLCPPSTLPPLPIEIVTTLPIPPTISLAAHTPTNTPTIPTPIVSTMTATVPATSTPSSLPTNSSSRETKTPTPSLTHTPTPSLTHTPTPSLTHTPTLSLTHTPTPVGLTIVAPTVTPTSPTQPSTLTPMPSATPTNTPTPTLSPTPSGPFLQLVPNCGNPPNATFNVVGGNWPNGETVFLYWNDPSVGDTLMQPISPASGAFSVNWNRTVISNTTYLVKAASNSYPYPGSVISKPFTSPCPFLQLLPSCGNPPNATFNVVGGNWPNGETIFLYWHDPSVGDTFMQSISPASGAFSVNWNRTVVSNTTYLVKAASNSYPYPGNAISKPFTSPCPFPPTPTPGPTNPPTPAPEDLIIVGPPELISTPPIVAYQPVQFRLTISNTGGIDIAQLFFVDIFIDPGIPIPPDTINIPLNLSDGHSAISSLPGNTSRTIFITAPLGFTNTPETHLVYGMVDSVEQINEIIETNNISTPETVINVTPANTPTPSPTPGGNDTISGIVRVSITNWIPAYRALVALINSSSVIVAQTYTDDNGFYQFTGVPVDVYTVTACYEIDGAYYFGSRMDITPPDPLVNIFMLPGSCP